MDVRIYPVSIHRKSPEDRVDTARITRQDLSPSTHSASPRDGDALAHPPLLGLLQQRGALLDDACINLTSPTHEVFAAISNAGTGKTGIAKTSAQNLRSSLGLCPEELEAAVAELARAHLLVKSEFDDLDRFRLVGPRCVCGPRVGGRGRSQSQSLSLAVADGSYSEPSVPSSEPARRPGASRRRTNAGGDTKGRTRSLTSAWGLASYLEEALLEHHFGKYPGGVVKEHLATHIARWIHKDQVDPALVKDMIDTFVSSPANFRKGTPAWKSFVNLRQKLLADVERVSEQDQARTHIDREYWTNTDRPKFDPGYWGTTPGRSLGRRKTLT